MIPVRAPLLRILDPILRLVGGCVALATLAGAAGTEITVVTANIRVALPEDEIKGVGWSARRDLCAEVIARRKPDVICLQEVLRPQVEDLGQRWPAYAQLGFAGPEMDARAEGYHGIAKNPIFFLRERFVLVAAGGFWLSETPHLPGTLSWGSARARHVTWIRLRERTSGREFRVLNTHLDHASQPARERQIALILEESQQYASDFPQVLAGDLNVDPTNPVAAAIRAAGWSDCFAVAKRQDDAEFTLHAFRGLAHRGAHNARRIDFIFTRGRFTALATDIVRDHEDGLYPSDHFFVSTRLQLDLIPDIST